jgi:hypothetical protein
MSEAETQKVARRSVLPKAEIIARADAEELHRIHASPAMGKGGRSFDLAGYRWRPAEADAGARDAQAVAYRAALCWNLAEGIRTSALESGVLFERDKAVDALLEAIESGSGPEEVRRLAAVAREADGRAVAGMDLRDVRLHDCPGCGAEVAEDEEAGEELEAFADLGGDGEAPAEVPAAAGQASLF